MGAYVQKSKFQERLCIQSEGQNLCVFSGKQWQIIERSKQWYSIRLQETTRYKGGMGKETELRMTTEGAARGQR